MAFSLFTPLFEKVDALTKTFVHDISSNAITMITPFVSIGLTLGFIAYALLIIRGAIEMPVMDFLGRSVRIGIITGIALGGGLYQSQIADMIIELPDSAATALITNGTDSATAPGLIDTAAGKGFDAASLAFKQSGWFSADGLLYGFFGILIIIATAILVAIGGAFILLAKIALALLAGLGPIFIIMLLWQALSRFFEIWMAQVVNYTVTVILFAALFGLCMSIYTGYVSDIKFDDTQNVAYTLGGTIILSAAMILIMLQLPSIAGAISGGVGIGYMWEMRALRGGIAGAGRGAASTLRTGKAAAGQARRAGSAAVAGGRSVAGKAMGYFKGRKAA